MGFKMKYPIKKQYLTSKSKRRSGIKMPRVGFMVAHDTGNPTSTAANNVAYYERSRNQIQASAHIFVDDKEIIECIPFLTGTPEKAWHVIYNVTTDNKMYGADANDVAGGVELCFGAGINSVQAYKRYIWVLAYSCYKHKLNPAKEIVGHDVLDPGRKVDPSNAMRYMGKTYAQLLKDVVAEYNDCVGKTVATPAPSVSGSTHTITSGDTFWGIAQRSNGAFTVQDLISWNPSVNPGALKIGTKINIKKVVASTPAPPKQPASTTKYPVPTVVLKYGSKGTAVTQLQNALCAVYFYPDKNAKNKGVDGSYGPATRDAVRRFQSVYTPSMVDGIFGPATRAALEKQLKGK